MSAMQLTEEQKNKLLEMCKALFPEYVNVKFTWPNRVTFWQEKGDNISIHWFEFCMTWLAEAILKDVTFYKEGKVFEVSEFRGSWKEWNIHPIDFLYYRFTNVPIPLPGL